MNPFLYEVNGEWRTSVAPEVDATYWKQYDGTVISEGWEYRSIGVALRDWHKLADGEHRKQRRMWSRRRRIPVEGTFVPIIQGLNRDAWQSIECLWDACRSILSGRSLLLKEVGRLLAARGAPSEALSEQRLAQVLQMGVLQGEVRLASGVQITGRQSAWRCERCASGRDKLQQTVCARCGGTCYYCDACLLLGRSTVCEPLLQIKHEAFSVSTRSVQTLSSRHSPSLTPAQQRAAETALQFIKSGKETTMLMWAVTGAGKTEMTFEVVAHVLNHGGKVAVATPRKDVVNELTPRFRQAFPQVRTVKLHGDSGETWEAGELVIATTHQLLRWYRAFDLIIVDEVDAFPYRNNASLEAGILRALKMSGQQLWLTATPPRRWQTDFHRGRLPGVTIPARYHRHPLPEPRLTVERRLWKHIDDGRVIPAMRQFFEYVQNRAGQAYVFVPGLPYLTTVINWIRLHVKGPLSVAGVSSRDRERSEKVERFRDKEYDCLVTTTILERGVTVSNAHVLILHADHPIFDEAALVQMSGRSGRSADYPTALVTWIATENSEEIRRAVHHIQFMNREAKRHGWLHDE